VTGGKRDAVPYYGREQLEAVLDFTALMDAIAEGHRSGVAQTADSFIGPPKTQLFVRSAVLPGQAMGAKVISVIPDNPSRGAPSIQAVFVLLDGVSGAPRAVLDGTSLTYWKTAGDSALGARLLSRDDARVLLMAGAGEMAPWLVRAHRVARPGLTDVLVWNRTGERAAALAATLAAEGIPAAPVGDLEAAVRRADIISTATMAREPLIFGAWLKPGAHLDLVGAYNAGMREADDECIRRARVFCDFRGSAMDVGEILQPIASGAMTEAGLLGDLYDLVQGAPGRLTASDITVFKNAGGAHLDTMTAGFLLRRLEENR
jgi:ornithine cyclodeaminase/alanine dehydrogenase-like protein (mu-crystallin family)